MGSDKLKFRFWWNGGSPNEVAFKVIQDHYISHTTSWIYHYRDGFISVYLPCDGYTIIIDIVGAIGWFYELLDHIICKSVSVGSGSRKYWRRWCRWRGSRCCGWWVCCRCLIIITIIFLKYCGGWFWCSCDIINDRWCYLSIYDPLLYGFDMTFYSGFGTRRVFLNLLWCDTRKLGEVYCINWFGKCLDCWKK